MAESASDFSPHHIYVQRIYAEIFTIVLEISYDWTMTKVFGVSFVYIPKYLKIYNFKRIAYSRRESAFMDSN